MRIGLDAYRHSIAADTHDPAHSHPDADAYTGASHAYADGHTYRDPHAPCATAPAGRCHPPG